MGCCCGVGSRAVWGGAWGCGWGGCGCCDGQGSRLRLDWEAAGGGHTSGLTRGRPSDAREDMIDTGNHFCIHFSTEQSDKHPQKSFLSKQFQSSKTQVKIPAEVKSVSSINVGFEPRLLRLGLNWTWYVVHAPPVEPLGCHSMIDLTCRKCQTSWLYDNNIPLNIMFEKVGVVCENWISFWKEQVLHYGLLVALMLLSWRVSSSQLVVCPFELALKVFRKPILTYKSS